MNTPISSTASSGVTIRALVQRFVVSFGFMGLCFFATAGTLVWIEAWAYLAVQFAASLLMSIWMWRHDKALLKSRMQYFGDSMQGRDRMFMRGFLALMVICLLIPGLDAVRFGWSTVPLPLKIAGLAGAAWSMWLIFRVVRVNSFASTQIEVQKERGHKVIDTGPYAVIRHPMYSGFGLYLLCVPLALGSWWMLLPGLLVIGAFLLRIPMEEQTLRTELDGYTDYCRRVPHRLIPGVW